MAEDKRRIDVMVSSTSADLEGHRDKAREAILRVRWQPEMMEHDGAAGETALERSLRYVDAADVYILILGFRYGSIPEIDANPDRLSYTELEYRHARERQKRGELVILTFLMDEGHPRTRDQIEQDPEKTLKLNAFRAEVADASDKGVSAFFTSPETLYGEVLDALHKLARQWGRPVEPAAHEDAVERYLTKTLPDSILEVGSIANLSLLDKTFVPLSADVRQQTGTVPDTPSVLDDPDLDMGGEFGFDFTFEDAPPMELHGAVYAPRESEHYGEPEYTPDIRERVKMLRRVVVLGAPGAGKTFTLARLALDYVSAYRGNPDAPLPVFVPLSTYRVAQGFEAFLDARLDGLPYRDLNIVWLLDALNEMPREYGQLTHLKAFIKSLVAKDAPFVLTCRVRNYDEELRDVPDLHRVDLQDLNPRQIYDILTYFIGADYAAQVWDGVMYGVYRNSNLLDAWDAWDGGVREFWERPASTLDKDATRRKHLRVRDHIFRDPRKLMLLCRNPFTLVRLLVPRIRAAAQTARQTRHELTTLLGSVLPNNRAQLFGQVIDGMLKAEAERKDWTDADRAAIQSGLEFTATALQATEQRTEIMLAELLKAENAPTDLSERLKMGRDAGLITLTETSARFNHQLYQEYFATRRLRDLLADYSRRYPDWEAGDALPPRDDRLAELFPDWWDVKGWGVTVALLGELEGHTGIHRVVRWLASYTPSIALETLIQENNDGLTVDDLNETARKALASSAKARIGEANPVGRAAAYRVLGHPAINVDERSGIGVKDGVPEIAWSELIPAGEYPIGGDEDAFQSLPAEQYKLKYSFRISKYPITYGQFQAFLDASDGYGSDEYDWFEGLAHPDGHKAVPGDQAFKYWNHPRERVSWYDAMAFTRWLSWKETGEFFALAEIDRWPVRLPTEKEWEIAARGPEGLLYPYGSKFDRANGNTGETGIRQTSAVGIFPDGAAWCDALDMSGNVWEWCLTDYANPQLRAVDENLRSDARRVLRGGSWYDNHNFARAAYRHYHFPDFRFSMYGFRLVRAPSL